MEWWFKWFPPPPSCWACPSPVRLSVQQAAWKRLCISCKEKMTPIRRPFCTSCGRELKREDLSICFDCVRIHEEERICNRSAVSYSPFTKQLIQIYKYRGKESLARPLGEWIAEVAKEHFADLSSSWVTFVPMHKERLQERGFNQAELLAIEVGKQLRIPVLPVLERVRPTSTQSKRNRPERLLAMQNVFQVIKKENRECIKNIRILVVDDVYTTGATLRECAKSLRQAGVSDVCSVTFAR